MKQLIFCLVFLPITLIAQEYVDVFKFGYSYSDQAKFKDTNENTSINAFNAAVTLPIELSSKHVFLTGVDFSSHNLWLSPEYNQSTTIYNTIVKVGLATTFTEKWSTTLVLLPKIASDYKTISGDDFNFGIYAIAKLKKSEHFKFRFGLYASTELFGVFATPIIGAYYLSPHKRFEIDASLPITAAINYHFESVTVGFDYFAIGRSYNISQETSTPLYVDQRPIEASTYIQFGLAENSILLRTKVGFSSNTNEVYKQGDQLNYRVSAFSFGDNRTQLNPDILGSIFLKFEAIYRIHFKKNNATSKI
ncbi:MAG: hypothetical protein HON09_02210 [Flavobacteriaceae bacterium]|nr:hypothetical protein [Flavobacteriaceae bacterium]